jgi:2-polyprenyl-6-methoxyphenol hydroxylase-like FAD-dependent oxidoreductase
MDADVIIAGGGPVGLGLAIGLGQAGIRTIVVERHAEIQQVPKGQNLTQRTMEHFHFWGAERALRAARTIPASFGIAGMTAYGNLLSGYHYDWLQRELVRPFYFTDNERLPQYATERVLRDRLAQLPQVEVRYGWTVEAVAQEASGVSMELSETRGEARQRVAAPYLVGCDGSRSTVREAADIPMRVADHDKLMVLLVFHSKDLGRLMERFPGKSFCNVLHPALDGYWQFFGRVDLNDNWFFHAPVPVSARDGSFNFAALLHKAVGAEIDVSFEYVGFWDLRFATARSYRSGRVLIAGDAAHSHPPYGGYGINTGFEDARNLSWKLTAVLRGWGGPALLDSYDAERRPVFESTSRDFIEKAITADSGFLRRFSPDKDREAFAAEWAARAAGARGEIGAFEPNYESSPIIFGKGGRTGAVGEHRFEARAGHHLAPAALSDGRNLYEALGDGFTIVALDAAEDDVRAFKQAAAEQSVPLSVVCDTNRDERARYHARMILVRPDQFVAWSGNRPDPDPAQILTRSVGAP